MASQVMRIPAETRDKLMRFRLRVAAEIGKDISMGAMVGILITLGESHYQETVSITREVNINENE